MNNLFTVFKIEVSMSPKNVEGMELYPWVVYEHHETFIVPQAHGMAESPERAFVEAKMHHDRLVSKKTVKKEA